MKLKYLLFMLGIILSINLISAVGTMLNCSNDPSIMACWHFNNDSSVGESYIGNNSLIFDGSTYHYNNGTSNASFVSNGGFLNDGSFNFTRALDFIYLSSHNSLSFGNNTVDYPFSISVWVKPQNFSLIGSIFAKYQNPYEYYLSIGTDGKPILTLRDNSAAVSTISTSTTAINVNQWNNIITTYDGSGGATAGNGISIYINGIKVSTVITNSATYVSMENTTSKALIGLRATPTTQNFNGEIDELIVFNKTLTKTESKTMYYNFAYPNVDIFSYYNCTNKTNLVFCSHLNNQTALGESYDTSGFIYDNSGNFNYGTLSNTQYNNTNSLFNDGSLGFNNVNSTVKIIYNDNLNFTTNFTVSLFLKKNDTQNQDIIERWSTYWKSWALSTSGDNIYISISTNGTVINDTQAGSINIIDNEWHNVIATFSDTSITVYIDGIQDFSMSYPGFVFAGNDNITISNNHITNQRWNGSIDEVLIFNQSFNSDEAVELYSNYVEPCNSSNLIEGCIIKRDTVLTLNGSSYNFDGSSLGYVFSPGNNVTINCNNSKFVGSNITNSRFLYLISKNNITVNNCSLYGYDSAIRFTTSDNIQLNNINVYGLNKGIWSYYSNNTISNNIRGNNVTYFYYIQNGLNNTFKNSYTDNCSSWCIYNGGGTEFFYVTNNVIRDRGIYNQISNRVFVSYNNFSNIDANQYISSNPYLNNTEFNNNYILGSCNLGNSILFQYGNNITLNANRFINTSINTSCGSVYPLIFSGYANFKLNTIITIKNNLFDYHDIGIRLMSMDTFFIYNNTFNHSYTGRDGYGNAIGSQVNETRIRNGMIYNNTFDLSGINAVEIQGANNISIFNNWIRMANDSQLVYDTGLRTGREVRCGIAFVEVFKTWTGDGNEWNYNNVTNRIGDYKSYNVRVYNNTFHSDTQCFYRFQGTVNYSIEQGLTNFWYRIHHFPTFLVDKDEFYLSSNFDHMTTKRDYTYVNTTTSDLLGTGWKNDYFAKYKFYKNYSYYLFDAGKIESLTNMLWLISTPQELRLFNLTNSLIYYMQNNTIKRTDTVNQQLNYTLNPNKELYVYNETTFNTTKSFTNALIFHPNYTALNSSLINGYYNIDIEPTTNITYAIENFQINDNYTYANSPINVTSTNDNTVYKMWTISNLITNNLTNMKTNLSFYQCNRLSYVLVVPKGQDPYITMNYTCTNNRLFINNVNLSYSVSSDEIYAFYDFTNLAEIYQTFDNPVLSGSYQSYRLVLSYNASAVNIVKGELNYNGTIYNSTMSLSPTLAFFDTSFNVPLVNTDTDYPFFWNISLTNSTGTSYFISEYNNQTVVPDVLALCDYKVYNYTFINFTTINWLNDQNLNSTFKVTFIYNDQNYSYQDLVEDNYTYPFCFIPQDKAYIIDAIIEYDATGYAPNYYYLYQANLTNQTNNINLYLLNSSYATYTKLKVYDESHNNLENVYITIQAYDVGTNSYKTVAMAKTDYLGEDISYLNWYNTFYKFILTRQGQVLYMSNVTKITETPKNFQIRLKNYFPFDKFENIVYSLTYNNISKNFVLTYVLPSGEVTSACLRVIKRTFKNDTEICNVCETSQSATLYCNIAAYGNGTYIGLFYATGSLGYIESIVEIIGFSNTIFNLLGEADATIYAFLFSGIVLVMFMITPVLAIVGLILGVLGGMMLGFQPMNYMEFMGIVIIGGIIIWMLK